MTTLTHPTELKQEVTFYDANNLKIIVKMEIRYWNGHKEFSMSGTHAQSAGQCQDSIVPNNDAQAALLELWDRFHLKNIEAYPNFERDLNRIIADIESAEKYRNLVNKHLKNKEKLEQLMEEWGISEGDEDACAAYLKTTNETDLRNFYESYRGQFNSNEDFAQTEAEECGLINRDATWPNNCIDWEHAARELMMDYTEQDGYYFRKL